MEGVYVQFWELKTVGKDLKTLGLGRTLKISEWMGDWSHSLAMGQAMVVKNPGDRQWSADWLTDGD